MVPASKPKGLGKPIEEKMMTIDYAMSWEFIHMWLRSHPEIGTLCRDGEAVFYVYPAGGEYRELKAFETP